LGGGSIITDETSKTYQTLAYAPYGESLVNIRHFPNESYDERYQFTGYEKDEETGLDYAVNRYYWGKGGIMISVDPHAESYPWISSYAYCSNNPVNRIDPNGMDDYELSSNGKINEKKALWNSVKTFFGFRDKTDMLIAASGEKLLMKSGTMQNIKTEKDSRVGNKTSFEVKNFDMAEQIHEFISENTKVEFSNVDAKINGQEISVISTIHELSESDPLGDVVNLTKRGADIVRITHSHPGDTGTSLYPSGYSKGQLDTNDKNAANWLNKMFPTSDIIQRVYHPNTKAYIYYNANEIYKTGRKKVR
jgi:RHS repeat-associated protein